MITLNNFKNIFKEYVEKNKILNSFYFGSIWDLTNTNTEFKYPLQAFIPNGTTVSKGTDTYGTQYNAITFNFTVIVSDVVNGDESNNDDILSDSIQLLSDFISFIDSHEYFIDNDINLIGDLIMSPFYEKGTDVTTGHTLEVRIQVPWKYTPCNIPMSSFTFKNIDC